MLERVMGCNSDVSVCVCKLSSSAGPSHKLSLQQCTCRKNIEFDMHHIVICAHGTAGILFLYQTILAGVVAACNDKVQWLWQTVLLLHRVLVYTHSFVHITLLAKCTHVTCTQTNLVMSTPSHSVLQKLYSEN